MPAVSCKRRDVLQLELADYLRWADVASAALPRAVRFLHSERIFTARDMPYSTQLVPLTAILAALGNRADSHGITQKLRQWYWCGVFGEMYGGSTETRFAYDLQDVVTWIDGERIPGPCANRSSRPSDYSRCAPATARHTGVCTPSR